ncbi:putative nucleoside-diphosphate sugar epimerase [Terriglobus roseus DSM 18391]|uniref:Putative nucleoside-diphosphate sugar epimerase n=1 Tax=Terriglobus roseus (strain DSM 18391 / NRRL B-41598 / KBS 63) TaxID=926566 RepID=I3ZBL0_TERRK|nr:SDR family oxidoreductase [Terriglobus roseus]AFL86628.1 putative nucleoside-diphosphate sugar epimerase [Terriglobus roseus DSM 18391]
MKIVVMGGTGLIGSKVVQGLQALGHEAVVASPSTGVNILTGEGVEAALQGAAVVVDVTNSPSFADDAVMAFFLDAARNVLPAEIRTGVKHHVALSVVGAEKLADSGYMRAKVAQEAAIAASGVPYTVVRATQFFEFAGAIADGGTVNGAVHLPHAMMQPIAAEDVAATLVRIALSEPANAILELAGPDAIAMDAFAGQLLASKGDTRTVVADASATYFGAAVDDTSLVPARSNPMLGTTHFADWLAAR